MHCVGFWRVLEFDGSVWFGDPAAMLLDTHSGSRLEETTMQGGGGLSRGSDLYLAGRKSIARRQAPRRWREAAGPTGVDVRVLSEFKPSCGLRAPAKELLVPSDAQTLNKLRQVRTAMPGAFASNFSGAASMLQGDSNHSLLDECNAFQLLLLLPLQSSRKPQTRKAPHRVPQELTKPSFYQLPPLVQGGLE